MTKKTKPDAWMPLYTGDWDGDTGHLDCEQDGAYGRLIRFYWRNGPLIDDDAALARIIRMPLSRWRRLRPIIAAFFVVADGLWRHKRADHEREQWALRKERAVERAKRAAGKRWQGDASSNATSTPQALLERCPSSSSTEVGGLPGQPTLCAKNEFLGPKEVRETFCAELGEEWCRSYLDHCAWQDVPERALVPATRYAGTKLVREGRKILAKLGLLVLERAA